MREHYSLYRLILILLLATNLCLGQDSLPVSKKKKFSKVSKIDKAAYGLKKSLETNDELKIAQSYESIAQELYAKGEKAKAEEYFAKALASYIKINAKEDEFRIRRSLAKVQESQRKFDDAIKNYEAAGNVALDKKEEKINDNDAKRLRNISNPKAQADLVQEKIDILESKTKGSSKDKAVAEKEAMVKKAEVLDAYKQQAEISKAQNKSTEAIASYNKAIVYAKDKPTEVIKIKNEIAKVYAEENEYDKAITINEKLLNEAKLKNDFGTQITQLQSLSDIYFKKQEANKGVSILTNAYNVAVKNGKTTKAKNILLQLITYYKSIGKQKESMALYDDFLKHFDQLIKIDTTLIDAKTFQITEDKIKQLEKEKSLKDELISKKNTFNYFLIASMVLLLLFFGLIAKALYAIKRKNKEIALQSLRREMNPHFIFNSLNSVNQFIAENKELEANKYLTSYSQLMRNTMENSNRDFVSLISEIEQLKKYLDLEHLRFQDKFEFQIQVDEQLDPETTFVPNMIIQPHLENAIWHGLRYLENKGMLLLQFNFDKDIVQVTIDDNGIGLTKSKELKTLNQKVYESRGITNTSERIALLNDLYKQNIAFKIEEKTPHQGTIATITFPLITKI